MKENNNRLSMESNKQFCKERFLLVSPRAKIHLIFCLVIFVSALWLSTAKAQEDPGMGTAPAMSNVKEMIMQAMRMGSSQTTNGCGLVKEELEKFLLKTLKNYGLPAFSVIEAKPTRMDAARIEIIPEVINSNSQGLECTSWVSLTAQTQNTLRIPPVETPRSVIVTYWRGGLLVNSAETSHPKAVSDAFDKLSKQLSLQYNRDQPPELPAMEEEKKPGDAIQVK